MSLDSLSIAGSANKEGVVGDARGAKGVVGAAGGQDEVVIGQDKVARCWLGHCGGARGSLGVEVYIVDAGFDVPDVTGLVADWSLDDAGG